MKSVLVLMIVMFVPSHVVLGQSQVEPQAKYSPITRDTSYSGTVALIKRWNGKFYFMVNDHYGVRTIGLKEGYNEQDLQDLLHYSRDDFPVPPNKSLQYLIEGISKDDKSNYHSHIVKAIYLEAQDYWPLYDLIVKQGDLDEDAKIFRNQW